MLRRLETFIQLLACCVCFFVSSVPRCASARGDVAARERVVIEFSLGEDQRAVTTSNLLSDLSAFFETEGWRVRGMQELATPNVRVHIDVQQVVPKRSNSCLAPFRTPPPGRLILTLTASVAGRDEPVARASREFELKAPYRIWVVPREWVQQVAAALEESGGISECARVLIAIEKQQEEEKLQASQAFEDRLWFESGADGCARVASLSALGVSCAGVDRYLRAYPHGRYADEARRTLARGGCHGALEDARKADEARITTGTGVDAKDVSTRESPDAQGVFRKWQLAKTNCGSDWNPKDEEALGLARDASRLALEDAAWRSADPEGCRKPASSLGCDGVANYLSTWPEGVHAAEARRLVANSASRISTLKRKEDAEREAAERRKKVALVAEELCDVLGRIDSIQAADDFRRRVDAASGTENLTEKRGIAASLISLGDRRDSLLKRIKEHGGNFDRKRDCQPSE